MFTVPMLTLLSYMAFSGLYVPAPIPLQRSLPGHHGIVNCVIFSPDGRKLLTGDGFWDRPGCIRLWDTATAKLSRTFMGHKAGIIALAYSPDGKLIASGSYDKRIIVWDSCTGKKLCTFSGHTQWVTTICFSFDGKLIASGSDDKSVIIWNIQQEKKMTEFHSHEAPVKSVAFSPIDHNIVATASLDTTIRLFNIDKHVEVGVLHHDGSCLAIAISPDGQTLVSGTGGNIKALQGNAMATWKDVIKAVKHHGKVFMWDLSTLEQKKAHELDSGHVAAIAYSPKGKVIGIGTESSERGKNGKILFLNSNATSVQRFSPMYSGNITSIAFSPDGKYFAFATDDDKNVFLCNVSRMRMRLKP